MAGFKGKLIRSQSNAKTIKGDGSEFETAILYLAPADLATTTTLCPMAEIAACKSGCLFKAGRGVMSNVEAGRVRRSEWFERDRDGFMETIVRDVAAFERRCKRKGVIPVVRLNGTSDVPFERIAVEYRGERFPSVFAAFPDVQFYDYTKTAKRALSDAYRSLPNYHLVLSWSGASERYAGTIRAAMDADPSLSVAVVFRDKATVERAKRDGFMGREVVDGDETDLRFLDRAGVVVALYAKGPARRDRTGFVVDLD